MPDRDLTAAPGPVLPGFFGKLPTSGDFVARGLPPAFTAPWDRWIARHLAARLTPDAPPLRFLRAGPPPMAGVIAPSADRAGRRFPLTLAAPGAPDPASPWFDALAGLAAAAGALTPDALAARLAALAVPTGTAPPAAPLLLWTDPAHPVAADLEAPGPALDALLGRIAEAHGCRS